jgi:hypothetical protein
MHSNPGRVIGAVLAVSAATLALIGGATGDRITTASSIAAAQLSDGFEDQTGPQPAGIWTVSYPDCQGTGTASIDTATAHSGTRSVRVNGGGGYCNHVFVGTPTTSVVTGSELYGRFWVRHSTALPAAHVTFSAMLDTADGGRDLRIGGQNGALQWNRESDDATLPEQSPAGVALSKPLPVNEWTCVEFRIDTGAGNLDTWVNGELVAGLVVDGLPTHDIDSQWLNRGNWRPQPTDFRFGWESYGGETDTLWFDDIVLSDTRPGCGQ